jgi:hypothetical protein
MTKSSIPRSYQPWCVIVPVIVLEAITAANAPFGPWQWWAGVPVLAVMLMEAMGVATHADWMSQMDARLALLSEQRVTLLSQIDHLRVAANTPDTRMDRLKSTAKGVANVATGAVAVVALIGAKTLFGAAVGDGGFGAASLAKDAGLETAQLAIEGVRHAGKKSALATEPTGFVDSSLPSERAARDLTRAEGALVDLNEVAAIMQKRRVWRERWRARVLLDTAVWSFVAAGAGAAASLIRGA